MSSNDSTKYYYETIVPIRNFKKITDRLVKDKLMTGKEEQQVRKRIKQMEERLSREDQVQNEPSTLKHIKKDNKQQSNKQKRNCSRTYLYSYISA